MVTLAYLYKFEEPARFPHGGRAGIRGMEEDSSVLHLTSIDNVVDGVVRNPAMVKHGIIDEKRISDLSWWIDPGTHLNLDFPDHLMNEVFVASRLENGARILGEVNRIMYAAVNAVDYRHLGKVQPVERRRRISLRPTVHR
ncbi:MAG: hypothetical protein LUO97_03605 [Methanomicrobiales archaeon]|nr:hypothetical protein [Methanomicrobiales archaeon]MDD1668867.1 hypothetical protein [Methanomicrobiales archaeon]